MKMVNNEENRNGVDRSPRNRRASPGNQDEGRVPDGHDYATGQRERQEQVEPTTRDQQHTRRK